jgi:hypothetical protein
VNTAVPRYIVSLGIYLVLTACGGAGSDNNAPVAKAGGVRAGNVLVGDDVILDGTASSDTDNDTLSYRWSLETVPFNSTATLSDPFSDEPAFNADVAGSYVARLVVNDGSTDSAPDNVTILVVIPPPTVTITTPAQDYVFAASPVMVTGTVNDLAATVMVNGLLTANNSGSYSADVLLSEGPNTIVVVATNSTGDSSATIGVVLHTQPGPSLSRSAYSSGTRGYLPLGKGFFIGKVLDVSASTSIDIQGIAETADGPPTVMVNGVTAIISPGGSPTQYLYDVTLDVTRGPLALEFVTFDNNGGRTDLRLNGEFDYCLKGGAESGIAALQNDRQNNRCHEIDGCNRNRFGFVGSHDTNSLRNLPMPNAIYNTAGIGGVWFGDGYIPAGDPRNDFFVHGDDPITPLGCNIHDTCYQTCAENPQAAYSACNGHQYNNHIAECRRHYVGSCPYKITLFGRDVNDPVKCPLWANEKSVCWKIANDVWKGVSSNAGWNQYLVRQGDYCRIP